MKPYRFFSPRAAAFILLLASLWCTLPLYGNAYAASSDLDANDIIGDPASPVLGNPKGKVTIVEFFDYRCPHCRLMQPRVRQLLKENGNVRLVLKEWPIFGGASIYAAEVALASNWQGRYGPVHSALFALPRGMNTDAIRQAVQKAGVDLGKLDRDMAERRKEIADMLAKNNLGAQMFQLRGTPGFIIGHDVYFGDLTIEQLRNYVTTAN